ncbi:unnamed protein product [Paramecium octaurelia]|uniref:Uncharacterized protein n=1 Tax=Paramecium octaurelia TaxID=43137 RepID=A0A8S1VFA1_PAROT|nr:unnamed protein product [Paramecium octaurelia]
MEVTIEMIGLDQEEAFTTILDDNTELINIGEMIKEASYYQSFNLSEQFCLEVKDTNKFISGRSTIIKKCLQQNQIDPKILVFHKGLDGQKKMNKGVIIDQNFKREPQINNQAIQIKPQVNNSAIHNQPQAQQQQSQVHQDNLMITNKNNQQGQGIVIGGGQITESQYIRNIEEQLHQGRQSNDLEVQNQLESSNNDLNQVQFQQISQVSLQQSQNIQQQVQQNEEAHNSQNTQLMETNVQNNKTKYNLAIWMNSQELEKYIELFRTDNIQFTFN